MTIKLNAKIRDPKNQGADKISAVVYGPDVTNASIELDYAEFKKVLKQAGESSLIELNVEGEKEKRLVLVHEIQKDRLKIISYI
jgi:ribosomal protein L25 (general stress protein Ctc)